MQSSKVMTAMSKTSFLIRQKSTPMRLWKKISAEIQVTLLLEKIPFGASLQMLQSYGNIVIQSLKTSYGVYLQVPLKQANKVGQQVPLPNFKQVMHNLA